MEALYQIILEDGQRAYATLEKAKRMGAHVIAGDWVLEPHQKDPELLSQRLMTAEDRNLLRR